MTGEELEARVQRLYMSQGATAHRNVLIYASDPDAKHATDVDVIAFRYDENFRREATSAECKSGHETPVFDRLLWLSGVKKLLRASRSQLYTIKGDGEYYAFAERLGVELVTTTTLEEIEASYGLPADWWPGRSDTHYWQRFSNPNDFRDSPHVGDEVVGLAKAIVKTDHDSIVRGFSYNSLNRMLRIVGEFGARLRPAKGATTTEFAKYYLSIALVNLSHSLLQSVHELLRLPRSQRADRFRERMTFGDQDPQLMRTLVKRMDKLVRTRTGSQTDLFVDVAEVERNLLPPEYADELFALLSEYIGSPSKAVYLPFAAEMLSFPEADPDQAPSQVRARSKAGRHALELLRGFLIRSIGIPSTLLEPLQRTR